MNKAWSIVLMTAVACVLSAQTPDFAAPGSFGWGSFTVDIPGDGETMTDSRVYHPSVSDTIPQAATPCPIVVFGHGWNMGIDRYESFAEHLSSWGYVVCLPTYSNPVIVPNHHRRARCMVAAGRFVAELNGQSGHPLEGKLASDRQGFAGHSLGGAVSLLAASMYADSGFSDTLRVLVSLSGPNTDPDTQEELIHQPKMILGGTQDLYTPWETMKAELWDNTPPPGAFAVIDGANHTQFMDWSTWLEELFDGSPGIPRELQLELTRRYMTAFLERYLHDDGSGWNFEFCYGDSLLSGAYIDTAEVRELCGDADGSVSVTPADGYMVLNYLGSGPSPVSCFAANVTGDTGLTPADGYYLLNFFGSGPDLDCAPCEFRLDQERRGFHPR
jgi:dienelactone hydrolase